MTLLTTTSPLPGIYPQITSYDPMQSRKGKDNMGFGSTQHGEKFLLKGGGVLGAAEFIGAKVCDACGIPACQPTIVTIDEMGRNVNVFGSRFESGEHHFDRTMVDQWRHVLASTSNVSAFSALLAVDLVLGNDDRHWDNWFIHDQSSSGSTSYRLRAMDFSRSWPIRHPCQHPLRHGSENTWAATKDWALLGVNFDLQVFHETCARISSLSGKWLRVVALQPLVGVFLSAAEAEAYAAWWDGNRQHQVIDAINAMEYGVRP